MQHNSTKPGLAAMPSVIPKVISAMLPSSNDPAWLGLGKETKRQLQSRITSDATDMEWVLASQERRNPLAKPVIRFGTPHDTILKELKRLRRAAIVERIIAYLPTLMALGVAFWLATCFEPSPIHTGLTLLFTVFTAFGIISVRIQGKHRPKICRPEDFNRVISIARRGLVITRAGIAQFNGLRDNRQCSWYADHTIERITRDATGITIRLRGQLEALSFPACTAYRSDAVIPEGGIDAILINVYGTRFKPAHDDSESFRQRACKADVVPRPQQA